MFDMLRVTLKNWEWPGDEAMCNRVSSIIPLFIPNIIIVCVSDGTLLPRGEQ